MPFYLMVKLCALLPPFPQGLMSYEDFKRVFQGSEDEMESRAMGSAEGSSNFVTIAPKPIPELSELLNQVRSGVNVGVDVCERKNSGPDESVAQVSMLYCANSRLISSYC
jgi:hypothetical protein